MSDNGTWIEIVLLAMLAGFIGLRLVSVLGKRTGGEKALDAPLRGNGATVAVIGGSRAEAPVRRAVVVPAGTSTDLTPALQAIADVEPAFDPAAFLIGAQAAYRLILTAFWTGDAGGLTGLVSDEVLDHFRVAFAQRDMALPHSLVSIDGARIAAARMVGQMAEITVRFDATIASGGAPAAGHDVWTFSRHIGAVDPSWVLIATDADV